MTTETKAIQKTDAKTVESLILANMAEISKLAPKHVSPERLLKVLVSSMAKTPALKDCTAASLVNCFRVAAELGLDPGGTLGHLYLVPYGPTCTPIIGYRGMIELARRSGIVKRLEAHVVYEQERFDVRFGLEPRLSHSPCLTGDRGAAVAVYAVALLKDGSSQFEVMTVSEVNAIRDRSRAGKNGPWVTDWAEMAKKTVVRRLCKYLPQSPELSQANEVDDEDYVDSTVAAPKLELEAAQTPTQKAKAAVQRKLQVQADDAPTPEEVAAAESAQAVEVKD